MPAKISPGSPIPPARARLTPASQLLLRHQARLPGRRPLLVNPAPDDYPLLAYHACPGLTVYSYDYAVHSRLLAAYRGAGLDGDGLVFAPLYPPSAESASTPHDAAVIYLPKGRALQQFIFRLVAAALVPGAPVYLVGDNSAGIRSSRRLLEQIIGPVNRSEAGRHCTLYWTALAEAGSPVELSQWAMTYPLTVGARQLSIVSLPGVFSHGRLDLGTQLLLPALEVHPAARVLDFGCGSGAIGAVVQLRQPGCLVDLVDSSALALEAARRTANLNTLPINAIFASDVFSDVTGVYSHIFSNPPFHSGIKTDYLTATTFLSAAAGHLASGGVLRIVANRFLKYQPLITETFSNCQVILEDQQYRVYEARKG